MNCTKSETRKRNYLSNYFVHGNLKKLCSYRSLSSTIHTSTHMSTLHSAEQNREIAEFLADQLDQFSSNVQRSKMLVSLYNTIASEYPDAKTIHSTDILRSAVVFLHAALEELLRSLTIATFPLADATVLNEVPLIGYGRSIRAEKFLLGDLLKFRDKTIAELIDDCIQNYTARLTYNNRGDLMTFARSLGLKETDFSKVMPKVEAMLSRRHQIVHRGDKPLKKNQQWIRATALSPRHVESWIEATTQFVAIVLAGAVTKKYLPTPVIKRKNGH